MILQSLVHLYEVWAENGTLERPGWAPAKVSWGLEIDAEGELTHLVPLEEETTRGKKIVLAPQVMNVPAPVKRAVGIVSNYLCDNSSYVLGVDDKGKPERAMKCFAACRELHERLLQPVSHPAARAILRFFARWQPGMAAQHPVLQAHYAAVLKGSNLVFLFEGQMVHRIPELRSAWDEYYQDDQDAVRMRCLVTGEEAPIARLHPSIKGVVGAQSSGASLVSFNAPAFESYGCDGAQGLNAPVSQRAAFAYGAALNALLTRERHHMRLGDTTMVYWAEDGEDAYTDCFTQFFGGDETLTNGEMADVLRALAQGKNAQWNQLPLHPDNRFYILGLAPNASRLSVRFFLTDTFGGFAAHVQRHQERLRIVKPAMDTREELPVWAMLYETVNPNSRDKAPLANMAGETVRAILMDRPYPETLFSQVQLRIRAGDGITRGKAAIIKAYLLQHPTYRHKEVLTVQLNQETTYPPYLMGRLFAVLEGLQEAANPGINTTIRDRYFSSACATPAMVFPTLIRLAQAHLKKLEGGKRTYYDRQITQLLGSVSDTYPVRLSLQDQGVFQLGYYHQTQQRYMKKEERNNG